MLSIRLSAMCPIYNVSSIIARFANRVTLLQIESELVTSEQKDIWRIVPRCEVLAIGDGGRVGPAITRDRPLSKGARFVNSDPQVWRYLGTCLKTALQAVYSSAKLEGSG